MVTAISTATGLSVSFFLFASIAITMFDWGRCYEELYRSFHQHYTINNSLPYYEYVTLLQARLH
jgi:hypothetical protein